MKLNAQSNHAGYNYLEERERRGGVGLVKEMGGGGGGEREKRLTFEGVIFRL